ncbi:MAG: polyribonucleotide nucleotidyltransferase [Pseudomonadota bacterium]|nr:polyribonucleotide nucleotidyltransferase [Pseudomonadota bacterium]
MFNITKKSLVWGDKELVLETGKIARQADGSVMVTYGETKILCTVVGSRADSSENDFFPLTVHYIEKFYSVGKVPGGYLKREGRPSEKETLTSRLIDRPLRPLFPEGFKNEVQVICQVMSHDGLNNTEIPAIIGASAALTISGIPFYGPLGAAKVARINNKFLLNPTNEQLKESDLDLVVAGTKDGVLMVESEANELSEDIMLDALVFGQESYKSILNLIIELAEEAAKEPWELKEEDTSNEDKLVAEKFKDQVIAAYSEKNKKLRQDKLKEIFVSLESYSKEKDDDIKKLSKSLSNLQKKVVREKVLSSNTRIDGRKLDEVRKISCETGILPRSHGSALFTRGETQAIASLTLGTSEDEQMIDALEGFYKEKFMLHYNFPPFSVGEAGRMGGTGRREIGHGKLAWRAVHPILPEYEEFPYTLRLVSEITESNGSSSMATVCGSSLALMDAGVPIKKQVAGIAMGLIKDKDKFTVLSDILGDEDHLGDMDFKVAGTKDGITSLQMDIKIDSITNEIMRTALKQAKKGRILILKEMDKVIKKPNKNLNEFAPKMELLKIDTDKIREVIGTGGKVIREIVEKSGAKVDIDDDGNIKVSSNQKDDIKNALQMIHDIIDEPENGKVYSGKVVKVVDFGAFVNFLGKRDGLVHISALSNERVEKVTDVLNEGDQVKVKVIGFDKRGKVRLSIKDVD